MLRKKTGFVFLMVGIMLTFGLIGRENMSMLLAQETKPGITSNMLSIDKADYEKNGKIIVTYQGVTQEMISAQAWIGIYRSGGLVNDYLDYDYTTQRSGRLEFNAPGESGSYEMRFFKGYSAITENYVQSATVSFSVR
ncbi:MAG: hypothetical protein LBH07_07030 [Treponema sp.]|jgi:hypothetical protein|nr:hypothetical protein [Treponema sp.]